MNTKTAVVPLVVSLVLAFAAPASADPARHLGSTHLSKAENDRDVIRFNKCRRGINAVQLRVRGGQVEVEKLWVRYAKGGSDQLEVRERIPQGGESRWIDLRGGERCIKAIGIIGDTELSRDQARVDVYGR
jgi:hypothetical protein